MQHATLECRVQVDNAACSVTMQCKQTKTLFNNTRIWTTLPQLTWTPAQTFTRHRSRIDKVCFRCLLRDDAWHSVSSGVSFGTTPGHPFWSDRRQGHAKHKMGKHKMQSSNKQCRVLVENAECKHRMQNANTECKMQQIHRMQHVQNRGLKMQNSECSTSEKEV